MKNVIATSRFVLELDTSQFVGLDGPDVAEYIAAHLQAIALRLVAEPRGFDKFQNIMEHTISEYPAGTFANKPDWRLDKKRY